MKRRSIAIITPRAEPFGTLHTIVTGPGTKRPMGLTRVLLLDQQDEGFFLLRSDSAGLFAGDTWHEDLADAEHQATYEFGGGLGILSPVPDDVQDQHAYAKDIASQGQA